MKNYKTLIIITFLIFSFKSFSQSFNVNIEGGYNSGFVGKVGVGVNSIDWSDRLHTLEATTIGANLQYRINRIDNKTYQGPNIQAYVDLLILRLGINGAYLFNNGNSKFIIEPEIGITLLSVVTLKYTYNLTNTDGFFPDNYKKSGVLLSLDIPLDWLSNILK